MTREKKPAEPLPVETDQDETQSEIDARFKEMGKFLMESGACDPEELEAVIPD